MIRFRGDFFFQIAYLTVNFKIKLKLKLTGAEDEHERSVVRKVSNGETPR